MPDPTRTSAPDTGATPLASPGATAAPADGAAVPAPLLIDGRYAVERVLGRGGMGQVLLATDRRLDRRVALKQLPSSPSSAGDLRRLEHEARLVGSLGHPNVVSVHDFGTFEGAPYLVEEYLEGETLRARLARGPVPAEEAVRFAVQIARGLAAAHDKGVVHCDLKPENLMLTREGVVKILDFGVARLAAPSAKGGTLPDGTSTAPGFAGTPGYSSPEQIAGSTVDARSDLFSFGAVLYELLAGAPAFAGKSPVEVGYSVLHATPASLPAGVSRELRRLVLRCLEKDPAARFQSARDLAFDLEGLEPAPVRGRRRFGRTIALLLAAAAVALAALLLVGRRPRESAPAFRQLTFFPGAVWTARFLPDGREVAYTEAFDGKPARVYSLRLGNPQLQRPEASDAALLAVSPRGELALALHPEFTLFHFWGKLAVQAGADASPHELLEQADFADWGPDSSLAVVRRVAEGQQLEYPLRTPLFQTKGWLSGPRVSPDGKAVAFFHHPAPNDDGGALMLWRKGGAPSELAGSFLAAKGLAWSPDGSEIWFTAGDAVDSTIPLRAIRLDGRQRLLARTEDDLELQDVSRAGTALVTVPHRYLGLSIQDAQGERDLSIRDEQMLHDLSPDGSAVLFVVNPRAPDGEGVVFVRRTDGAPPVQIATGYGGALSPDGTSAFVFPAVAGRPPSIVPIGPGETRVLESVRLSVSCARYFPDGRRVLLVGREAGSGSRLYVLPLDDGTARSISDEGVDPARAAVSPDGRVVAAVDPTGRVTLYPSDGAGPRRVPDAAAGEVPFGWTPDGGLVVGRLLSVPLELFRIDPGAHRRTHWKTVHLASAVSRLFFARGGEVLAFSQNSFKTHLYAVDLK